MKFTFDGHGINDAENEYKPRVATLQPEYKTAEVGNLLAAAPELLGALKTIVKGKGAYSMDPLEHCTNCLEDAQGVARAAIEQAEKVGTE